MATHIFLGEPPAHIKQWIIEHATPPGPAGHPETRFTLEDGTVETYNITGTLNEQWMADNGYYIPFDEETQDGGYWEKRITQADIGNTVTNIGNAVFALCSGLTSVTFPSSVTSIGSAAFSDCFMLTSMAIPNSVTSIGEYAFAGCEGLASMTFNSFTKNQVKSMTTEDFIFGDTFRSSDTGDLMVKSFTANCTDGSMTVHFSADDPATITFTDL